VQITAIQSATSTHKRKSPKSNENSVEMCIFAAEKELFEGFFGCGSYPLWFIAKT